MKEQLHLKIKDKVLGSNKVQVSSHNSGKAFRGNHAFKVSLKK